MNYIQQAVGLYFRDQNPATLTMPGKPSGTSAEEFDIPPRRAYRPMLKPSPMPKRSSAKLSEMDGLDNPERVRLLGIIDQFRELGVSEDISLPQVSPPVKDLY